MTNTTRLRRALGAAVVLGTAMVATGCGGPLLVGAITSRGNQVKFGYTQVGTHRQGVVQCELTPTGDTQNCRHMNVVFAE